MLETTLLGQFVRRAMYMPSNASDGAAESCCDGAVGVI
jgi:hypothetical protein